MEFQASNGFVTVQKHDFRLELWSVMKQSSYSIHKDFLVLRWELQFTLPSVLVKNKWAYELIYCISAADFDGLLLRSLLRTSVNESYEEKLRCLKTEAMSLKHLF